MTENEFRSHFISDQYSTFFLFFCSQNGCRRPFWIAFIAISDKYGGHYHFRSHLSPFQINTQLYFILFCSQNNCRGHFRSHFSQFQINMAAILDDRKSLSIAFLAISDQYTTFFLFDLFTKWLPAAILDGRKLLSIAFLAISDQYAIFFSQNGCSGYLG